jgi:hypothetical protein
VLQVCQTNGLEMYVGTGELAGALDGGTVKLAGALLAAADDAEASGAGDERTTADGVGAAVALETGAMDGDGGADALCPVVHPASTTETALTSRPTRYAR